MKTFEYSGFDKEGKRRTGLVEALGVKGARERLAGEGILAERIVATGRKLKFPTSVRAVMYRELSSLLAADVTIDRAMEILIRSPELTELHILLAGIRDRLREGRSLSAALSEASDSVSGFEMAIIRAAERSGALHSTLSRLALFLEEQERIKERVVTALIYPAIVMGMGLIVALVMVVFLVPRARAMLAGSGMALPLLTRITMGIGAVIMKWGLVLAGVAVAVGLMAAYRWKREAAFRTNWDRRLFRCPIVGRGYRVLVGLRFSRTLSVLLQGGVPLVEAMELAGQATGSSWISGLATEETEALKHGASLSEAVCRIPPLAVSLPGWIQVGEAGGDLKKLLDHAADRFQAEWDRYVTRCLGLLEPILVLVVGAFVLLVAISVLLPVISLTKAFVK